MKSISGWAVNLLFRSMVAVALVLPYPTRLRFFGAFFKAVVGPLSGYIRRSEKNLKLVFPDMPTGRAQEISRSVASNFGKNLIENYSKDDVAKALLTAEIGGDGLAPFMEAVAAGRPVLLLSGHIGNYEVIRLAIANMGHQSAGLYRPAKNTGFNAHYVKSLEYLSGPVFAQTRKGVLGFVRYLKAGGIAAMLFDVRNKNYDMIDFLGQPAHTSVFPAEIALKADALVIPCFAHRLEDGITHVVSFERPITHTTPDQMMQEATKRLEAQVLAYPDQWLWVHNRWEKKRPAAVPELPAPDHEGCTGP